MGLLPPPLKNQIPSILVKCKPYILGTKYGRFPDFQMLSIIVSPPPADQTWAALLVFVCLQDNSWTAQPIQTKFSHKNLNWNSSAMYENGHHRSLVTPLNRGLLPPLKFGIPPISTNPNQIFTRDFCWNRSPKFENGHQMSNVTPPNRGYLPPPSPPGKLNFFFSVDTITLEWLNQSEPNFHTWLLTGIALIKSKMGIAGDI